MHAMDIPRLYKIPSKSFFLFGPRGVGKSTWIKKRGGYGLSIDLLNHSVFLELQREPHLLEAKTSHLRKGDSVFIDEIQKLPALLDEVHRIMEGRKLEFILTGSSVRKLKRSGANLLAGRAHTYKMFPFSLVELGKANCLDTCMRFGMLPIVLRDVSLAEETLASYVDTYLREEIKEEALVRRIEEFSRFLAIAGQLNAQVLNFENVARETGKSSKTVQGWYQILEETLLGYRLEPYRPAFKVREGGHGKFYWFDCAVARKAAGLSWADVDQVWKDFAFETILLKELLTYMEVSRLRHQIYFYGTPGAGEIDFVIETRKKTLNRPQEFITIEAKFTSKWKREFEGPSRSLRAVAKTSHRRMLGVYIGKEQLAFDGFEVFPLEVFMRELFAGVFF